LNHSFLRLEFVSVYYPHPRNQSDRYNGWFTKPVNPVPRFAFTLSNPH